MQQSTVSMNAKLTGVWHGLEQQIVNKDSDQLFQTYLAPSNLSKTVSLKRCILNNMEHSMMKHRIICKLSCSMQKVSLMCYMRF